uniref:Secreted protein n=1 Tax=Opuntia streptacantha TaxID=393608 RepID=A0A7C9EAG6_OPUST
MGPSLTSGSIICFIFATSKSLMDVSALPVATNLPSGLNLAHLATFLCSDTCRVSCSGKLLDEPFASEINSSSSRNWDRTIHCWHSGSRIEQHRCRHSLYWLTLLYLETRSSSRLGGTSTSNGVIVAEATALAARLRLLSRR